MNTKVDVPYRISFLELPADEQQLLERAMQVRQNAQAPYSNYMVGAAVLSDQGMVHVGCNVERCTYTQVTHAEQNAIDSMIAALGPSKIEKIAVVGAARGVRVALNGQTDAIANAVCGHCLQIIWENCFQDRNVKILSLESNGIVAVYRIADLFPFHFGPENLNIFYKKAQ